MPDKQFKIGLSFTADTSKAREEINKLKDDLSKIISSANIGKSNSNQFNQIIGQAAELRGILEKATSATGKLDLSKFERGLKASNIDLKTMAQEFQKIDGGNFFNGLAKQVMEADTKVTILSGKLKKFAQGLMNTAMWTIQSNAIHAVEGALRSAYTYAQQLNKGLTDIAIVSDLSGSQLAQFAKTANQMAKDLSASTKDVVSGALIYYQAGLSDEEVIKRTETTIKLAQTSGESAEQISSYMTAIWNNFYDGSKSVEYYADVISYLGAVTAASNADIAEGMQSFSAVAQTVGLDFEDAAAAMTLLRDVTQQSASTIGNSLKTIFARLSSLKMGETLEDGVDLTKYTKALESVGVEVLDANGNLRDMSDIIRSLAENWDNLDRAQKDALAQTVGGVRQYNNLITLMDHFEEFEELVSGSQGATGYLQGQADEYAESWEGARNRLEAAWQGIYDQLIDDKFFIKLTNFLTGIVNFISQIIDGAGGLKGVISMLVMGISSLDVGGFAQKLRDVAETMLLVKDAITGVQEKANIDFKGSMLDVLFTQQDLTDNQDIMKLYDDQIALLEKINILKSEGNIQEAARLTEIFNRRQAEIGQLIEEDQELQKIAADLEQIKGISDVSDSQFNTIISGAKETAQYGDLLTDLKRAKTVGSQDGNSINEEIMKIMNSQKYANNMEASGILERALGLDGQSIDKAIDDAEVNVENGVNQILDRVKSVFKNATAEDNINVIESILGINQYDENSVDAAIDKVKSGVTDLKLAKEEAANAGLEKNSEVVSSIREQEDLYISLLDKIERQIKLTDDQRAAIARLKQEVKGSGPDWADMTTNAVRAASSLTAMSSGMQGLAKSFKDGKVSVGSLVGSFGSIWRGARTATDSFQKMSKILEESGASTNALTSAITFLGTHIWWLIAIVAAVTAAFWLFKKAQEAAYKASIEGRIEANNEALEKQRETVSKLASEYDNLKSKISDLKDQYEDLNNLQKGSAEWLIARQKYALELAELEKEYGSGVINADQTVNEEKLNEIILDRLNMAKAYGQELENNSKKLETEKVQRDVLKSKNSTNDVTKQEYGTGNVGYRIKGEDGQSTLLTKNQFEDYWNNIEQMIKSGDLDAENFQEKFSEAIGGRTEGIVYDYFLKKIEAYQDALNKEAAETKDFSDLAKSGLNDQGVYGALDYAGMGDKKDEFNEALNTAMEEEIQAVLNDDEAFKQTLGEAAKEILGGTYDSAKDAFLDANGEAIENVDKEALIRAYLEGEGLGDLRDKVREVLAEMGDPEALEKYDQYIAALEKVEAHQRRSEEKIAESVNDHGLDEDRVRALTDLLWQEGDAIDGVSDSLIGDRVAAAELADDILRFGEAVEQVTENYDDWKRALDSGNAEDVAVAMSEMKDAYSDLLDLDASDFSGEFLKSKENLEDLKLAIEGNEEAYQRLMDKAQEEILAKVGIDDTQFNEAKDYIISQLEEFTGQEWDNIEIGADLNDEEALAKMTELINAADMTAQQATDLLASMGIDAEVEKVPIEQEDKRTYVGAEAHVEDVKFSGNNPLTGAPMDYHFPSVTYTEVPMDATETSETEAFSLKVTSARKASGGNFKFNNSSKGGGNKGKGGKKGGGGGHGKEQKQKEKGTNRYHEVTDQLKRNKNALEILNQSKDRAFGQGRIDYMKQEIELLQQQAELYQKLAKEAEDYYNKDRNVLIGYGAQFNEDGSIKNFQSWYDSFIDKYNAGGMDDDAWKKFEDAIKNYEQSLDKLHEAEKGYNDAMNKIYDERLEIVTYKVKYLNELIEEGTKYLDYLIKQADKSIYEIGEKVGLLGQKAANAMQEVANIQNGIIEMLSNENHPELTSDIVEKYLNGSYSLEDLLANIGQLTEKERQQLLDYREQLLKWAETLDELRTEAYEQLSDSIDQFNDKIDHQKDIIEDLANVMKNYRDIVDIVGKDVLGVSNELLQQMNRVTLQSAEKNLIISRKQFDVIKDNYAKLRAEYESMLSNPEIGEADRKLMEKELADVYDQMLAAQNEYLDREKEALQKAVDNFKDNMQMIADTFDKAVSGTAGSLANLQEYFDLQKKVDDQYLPTYEQIYNLSKLTRDVNNAINNTDNIKGKERLKKLQQDILQAEREGKKLNEYDVGLLQRRLELEQALIAMEEARDAKNMVRMTRDNEGNWSYTYTQNPEDAEKARQDYEDKLYNLEKWNQDQVNAMQSAYLQQLQDYTNYINGLDITDEERNKRIGEKQRQLQEIYGDFLNQALQDGERITNEYGVQNHNLIDSFNETTLAIEGNFDSLNEMLDNFRINSLMADQEITASFQEWYENRERILNEAGQDLDNFTDILTGDMEEASQAMEDAADAAEEMSDNMGKEFQEILDNLKKMFYGEDGMSKTIDDIINKFKGWQQKILDVIKSIGELNNTKVNISVPNPSSGGGGGGGSGGGGGDSGSSGGGEGGGGGGCSGCTGTCSGGCSTGCSGGCRTGCKGCDNTCSGTCKNTSSQTGCAASCTGTCKTGCLATSKGGCFDPGTKILMGDGTEKNIEEIQYGDIIMTYNEETKEFIPEELFTMTRHHNTINMLYVELEDGTVLGITACHPILTTDGWKSLDYETALFEHNIETSPLEIGQEVLGYNKTSKIKNIIWRKNLQDYVTYNITLNNTHTFIANGYIAHNANQAATLMKNADGGLMGSWGPEGKFAMMHEKELVLNKEDTVNMLHTVGFVRDLVEMLTTNAGISASGLGNLLAGGVSSSSNYLDQNVTIHAEFPNATNHSEIEEAFNNLIGLAGQYAGRKQ